MTKSSRQLSRLLNRLAATRPGSRAANNLSAESELALLRMVKAGGKRGTESALRKMRIGAQRLTREFGVADMAQWRVAIGEKSENVLEVWFNAGSFIQMSNVRYRGAEPPKPVGSPAQRKRHEIQEAFYTRYTEVGQRWYRGRGPRRLPRADNVILLIGELEADVNNGGFSQYLDNKGRRRARSALAALKTVGAHKTVGMLTAAMAPNVTEKQLGALDTRFYRVPEDLAVVTMRWVGRTSP